MRRLILALTFIAVCVSASGQKPTKEERAALREQRQAEREERRRIQDSLYQAQMEQFVEKSFDKNHSQSLPAVPNNFKLKNGIIWQKEYETTLSADELIKAIYTSNRFTDIMHIDSVTIIATVKMISYDYKNYGLSYGNTPMYISQMCLGPAFIVIDIKSDKYRVTAKNIMLTQRYDSPLTPRGTKERIEAYAFEEGGLSDSFKNIACAIYQELFTNIFTFKKWEW